jgi:RHS repeat-associated protein
MISISKLKLEFYTNQNRKNQIQAVYIYATKINVPDYIIKGGERYKVLTDHLGSVRYVVRVSDGAIVEQIEYDSFGNVLYDLNPGFIPFGFAGGIYDKDTGLVRFGLRDYDPEVGRWTAKDPVLFYGGDSNLYGYVLDDPINIKDIIGLKKDCLPSHVRTSIKMAEAMAAGSALAVGGDLMFTGAGLMATGLVTSEIGVGIPIFFAGVVTTFTGAAAGGLGTYLGLDVFDLLPKFGWEPLFPPSCDEEKEKKEKYEKKIERDQCKRHY